MKLIILFTLAILVSSCGNDGSEGGTGNLATGSEYDIQFDGISIWPFTANTNEVTGSIILDPVINGTRKTTLYFELNGTAHSTTNDIDITNGVITFRAINLPQGNYHVRIWIDGNGNGGGGTFTGAEIGDYYSKWHGDGSIGGVADGPSEWYATVIDGMGHQSLNFPVVQLTPSGSG